MSSRPTKPLDGRRPTAAQQGASRSNGSKSQGPVTERGKQISAMNALRNGLRSETGAAITHGPFREDEEAIEAFVESVIASLEPRDLREELAARQVATAYLWAMRLERYQTAAMQGAAMLSPEAFATVGGDPEELDAAERCLAYLEKAIAYFEGTVPDPFAHQLTGWREAYLFVWTRTERTEKDPFRPTPRDLDRDDRWWRDRLRDLLEDEFDGLAEALAWARTQEVKTVLRREANAGKAEAMAAEQILASFGKGLDHMTRIDRSLDKALNRYDRLRRRHSKEEEEEEEEESEID